MLILDLSGKAAKKLAYDLAELRPPTKEEKDRYLIQSGDFVQFLPSEKFGFVGRVWDNNTADFWFQKSDCVIPSVPLNLLEKAETNKNKAKPC